MDQSNAETPGLTNQARRAKLWDGVDADQLAAAGIDARTRIILEQLHGANTSELEKLEASIREGRTKYELMPLYAAVGDATLRRQMPSFITGGEWLLHGIVAWADPAAAANVNVQLGIDSAFPFPLAFVAPKADVFARSPLGIPVAEHDLLTLAAAGTVGDRVAVLVAFARLS